MPMLIGQSSDVTSAIMISLLLIGLTIAGFFVVVMVRRKMRDVSTGGEPMGFTLSDLRALHKSGKMTDEEFERAKGRLIAEAKARAQKDTAETGGDSSAIGARKVQPLKSNESTSDEIPDSGGGGDGGSDGGGGGSGGAGD